MATTAISSARTRTLPPRDARGRFVARPAAAPEASRVRSLLPRDDRRRVRVLPSRDTRGRFVSFPTTNAPNWYVLCADAYRIPGDAEVVPMEVSASLGLPPPVTSSCEGGASVAHQDATRRGRELAGDAPLSGRYVLVRVQPTGTSSLTLAAVPKRRRPGARSRPRSAELVLDPAIARQEYAPPIRSQAQATMPSRIGKIGASRRVA